MSSDGPRTGFGGQERQVMGKTAARARSELGRQDADGRRSSRAPLSTDTAHRGSAEPQISALKLKAFIKRVRRFTAQSG